MELYMDKKAEIQSRLVKAKAKQEGLPFRAALREEVLQIKGFDNYSEKINGGIADLYIELEDLNASINKLIESSQANKDDVVSAVGQDQYSEKLIDVNNSVIKLQTELLEKGLRVKSVEKLEAITKDVVKSIKAIELPTSMDIKSLPKGLASDKTLDQVNKNLLGITKQLKALEPKPLGRLPEDYVPFRRVISDGNRLYFDDFVAGGGAGGGSAGGGGDGAILDGVDSTIKATVKDIGTQITTNDLGLVSNSVIHGVTTAGGGGYVDVKVNPSGALTVESTISGTVTAFAKSTEQYAINNKEATATYKYFGFQKSDGGWYIMRKTIATNIFEYVAGASAYSTAWTNRATQTYTDYATAF